VRGELCTPAAGMHGARGVPRHKLSLEVLNATILTGLPPLWDSMSRWGEVGSAQQWDRVF